MAERDCVPLNPKTFDAVADYSGQPTYRSAHNWDTRCKSFQDDDRKPFDARREK
jgi:hypothetical protein